MEIGYNAKLNRWQIVYSQNDFIKKDMWHQPVNSMVFDTWDDAAHYLDKQL